MTPHAVVFSHTLFLRCSHDARTDHRNEGSQRSYESAEIGGSRDIAVIGFPDHQMTCVLGDHGDI